MPAPALFLFGGGSSSELLPIGSILRKETVGGALLVAVAIVALGWANSPLSAGYFQLRDIRVGYGPWHLELSLGEWASEGLLAIFFFLVGLELKREFLHQGHQGTTRPLHQWIDIFGVSLLGGIGFTVSLLVAELSFGHGSNYGDQATTGILAASLSASLLAAAVLLPRNLNYRRPSSPRPQRGWPRPWRVFALGC
jgi:Na+/H+ antiporter NhaA